MNPSALRIRITIQANTTVVDAYKNHTSTWADYFTCWATPSSGGKTDEKEKAAAVQEEEAMDLTVRYCPEVAAVSPKTHRVIFGDRIYNIIGIDDMGFRYNSRKFHVERARR